VTTIYEVSDREYSDGGTVGLYSTREDAERVRAALNIENDIIEHELDKKVDKFKQGLRPFQVIIALKDSSDSVARSWSDMNIDTEEITTWGRVEPKRNQDGNIVHTPMLIMYMWVHDEQHALKIASERRARYIALRGNK